MPIIWVEMVHVERAVSPDGVVYSTSPLVGESTSGKRYFVKGPEPGVVFAEALAYGLARGVGLGVPEWAMTCHGGAVCFASEACPIHSGLDLLLRAGKASDPAFWPLCLAFDMWVANPDRNPGNLVGRPTKGRRVEILAIDFEKAMILRGESNLSRALLPPGQFAPQGVMSRVRATREQVIAAAGRINEHGPAIVEPACKEIAEIPDLRVQASPAIASRLLNRLAHLGDLCEEVYSE